MSPLPRDKRPRVDSDAMHDEDTVAAGAVAQDGVPHQAHSDGADLVNLEALTAPEVGRF